MQRFHTNRRVATALAGALVASLALVAPAGALTVTVNGQSATLNPPPIMRAGRVFVPLRGVFEQLGAAVVYQNGIINATGNNRTVSLRIGSTAATVNGQPQTLDVAPFIIGASTYVPLRFVSQALGAAVNWDNANQIVAIQTGGGGAPPPSQTVTPSGYSSGITLADSRPRNGASVASNRPTIRATFSGNVDPNSLRVYLDGADVTGQTTRYPTGIVYAPPSPLDAMQHRVRITGNDANGARFRVAWSFTSGSSSASTGSGGYGLTLNAPSNGSTVPSTFTVSGRTWPGAQVHIVAGGVASVGGIFQFNTGSTSTDTTADGNGNFSQQVSLGAPGGAQIGLTVTATQPGTGASQQRSLTLRAGG